MGILKLVMHEINLKNINIFYLNVYLNFNLIS